MTAAKKSTGKKTASRAKASASAARSRAAQAAPRAASASAPAPAAPASTKPSAGPNWLILGVLIAVAAVVVLEMSVLLKGKVDRQRTLTEVATFGERGDPERPQAYHGAIALKMDALDRLYLVDPDWSKVVVWDAKTGAFLMSLDQKKAQLPGFTPSDVAADAKGTVFILDRAHQEVTVYGPDGALLRRWPVSNGAYIATDPSGNVLISDNLKMQVIRYSPEGKRLSVFGGPGSQKGRFSTPTRIATDASNNLYVLDLGNARVQVFSPQGRVIAVWPLKFKPNSVTGIVVHGKEVYVNDFENSFIWVYSPHGRLIGQASITFPSNLAIDSEGNLYLPNASGLGRYTQTIGRKAK